MNAQQNSPAGRRRIEKPNIPYLLRQMPVPPKQLWVEGDLDLHATGPKDPTRYLCVIGSRKHSTYGRESCERLIAGLRGYNICIVSGLALGIDSIAHEAALAAGLKTIAFPGSGLDRSVLYPQSKHGLARRIVQAGGALVSEFDETQRADIWTFPQRNRLMAGMSHATLMIEAAIDSGTLITAGYAQEFNRETLALPGEISSPLAYGPNKWIHMGARIVRSSEDILEVLGIEQDSAALEGADDTRTLRQDKLFEDLDEIELQIVDLLSVEPQTREDIIRKLGIEPHVASIRLSMLELKDLISWRGTLISLRV